MSDESWDEQFRQFLRKTGDDFKRTGEDIRAEAQRLLDAAMDPEKQQRVRDRLNELSSWARKTAQGVAGAVEEAASKAQTAFHRATEATENVSWMPGTSPSSEASSAAGGERAASRASAAARKPRAGKKTGKAKGKAGKASQKKGAKRKR